MDQDKAGHDYPKVNRSLNTEAAAGAVLDDNTLAPRERSSSDSPKSGPGGKAGSTDHSVYMSPRLRSILLWEKPTVSAAHLAASLVFVLLCRWVSLLNLICGLFVVGISGSFLYVNGLMLTKPAVRPLEKYYSRSAEFVHIEADTLRRRLDYVTDGLNVVLTELAKVVLIEDNKRSLKYIGIFYSIWTLRTWFSTTTLLCMILVSIFAAPRLYLDNQELIDAHVANTNDLVQARMDKGRQMAQEQWTTVYSKGEQFAKDKGILKQSEKKTE
ncbi:Reticulon-domain-containing protein [Dissophora ornata]|nr:hypothetical protein BGZ58_004085 [Dissophora ornata]KAI8599363.1 Reticulon-domain-containing protein [Dissophora ornata]